MSGKAIMYQAVIGGFLVGSPILFAIANSGEEIYGPISYGGPALGFVILLRWVLGQLTTTLRKIEKKLDALTASIEDNSVTMRQVRDAVKQASNDNGSRGNS